MIKIEEINKINNLVGRMIRNKKTQEVHYVESILVYKFQDKDFSTSVYRNKMRYKINNSNDRTIMSGAEHDIMLQLLNYELLH